MVTIIATVIAKKGNMEKVKEAFKEVVATVKATEPGTLEYIPHTVKGAKFKTYLIQNRGDWPFWSLVSVTNITRKRQFCFSSMF